MSLRVTSSLRGESGVTLLELLHAGVPPVAESAVTVPADMMAIGESPDGLLMFRRGYFDWGRKLPRHQASINLKNASSLVKTGQNPSKSACRVAI